MPPGRLAEFIERSPVAVTGLMTMPPATDARRRPRGPTSRGSPSSPPTHGLTRLSMGTSQDWEVAVEEGATIIRLGSSLFR